jgi:steroid delta-isomerase-like uncharacterized protein
MTNAGAAAVGLFDDWERRDFDAVVARFGPDAVVRDHPRDIALSAPADIRAWFEGWAAACPDSTASAQATVSTDDGAVIEGLYAGTNTGAFGTVPATGRPVSLAYAGVFRFDGGGHVVSYDAYYDLYSLFAQLGQVRALA